MSECVYCQFMRKQEHTFFPPDSPLPASERTIGGTRYSYFGLPLVPAQAGRLRMDSVCVKPRRTALFQSTSYMFRWQDRANSPEICGCGRPAHKILLPRYNLACLKIAYLYCFAWFTMESSGGRIRPNSTKPMKKFVLVWVVWVIRTFRGGVPKL